MLHYLKDHFLIPHPSRANHNGQPARALIELRQVVKVYPSAAGGVVALRGLDLCVQSGEFVCVLGKSGSGKSTLVNMITGIDRPTSGEVLVAGTAVHTLSEGAVTRWRGVNVGIVYQEYNLVPTLTVIENVMLPMDVCNTYAPGEFYPRALHLLSLVGIAEHAHKLPSQVSGGQQQRIGIARALANDPPLIVADEPTGNLDSQTAAIIFRLFEQQVAAGKTLILVTHDTEYAQRARRIITLADGEIVDDNGTPPAAAPLRAAALPADTRTASTAQELTAAAYQPYLGTGGA